MDLMNDLKNYYRVMCKDPSKLKTLMLVAGKTVFPKLKEKYTDEQIFSMIVVKFKFFPTVSELVELLKGDETNHKAMAEVWWDKMQKEVARTGYMTTISFSDPLVNDFIKDLGGWVEYCRKTYDELIWTKKEFIKFYASMKMCGRSGETKRLSGFMELHNNTITHEPVYVSLDERKPAKMLEKPERLQIEDKGSGGDEEKNKFFEVMKNFKMKDD